MVAGTPATPRTRGQKSTALSDIVHNRNGPAPCVHLPHQEASHQQLQLHAPATPLPCPKLPHCKNILPQTLAWWAPRTARTNATRQTHAKHRPDCATPASTRPLDGPGGHVPSTPSTVVTRPHIPTAACLLTSYSSVSCALRLAKMSLNQLMPRPRSEHVWLAYRATWPSNAGRHRSHSTSSTNAWSPRRTYSWAAAATAGQHGSRRDSRISHSSRLRRRGA